MGLRGIIRDILSIYIGFKLIVIWIFKTQLTSDIVIVSAVLLLIAIWFILERIGILPQL